MIYFYYGTDIEKLFIKSHDLIDSLRKKKPDAGFFKIDSENFNQIQLEEYIGGQGLFSNKYIVFIDRLCQVKDKKSEIKEGFLDKLKEISESENIFLILEGKLDKVIANKIEKKAEKTVRFDKSEKEDDGPYNQQDNIFEIANALGRRNKKEVWMLYRKYIDKGLAPEEIQGILFWKIKSMLLACDQNNWKNEELIEFLDKVITVYHEARRGNHELETGLEALLLS